MGRFFERQDGIDFPFYAGEPARLSPARWSIALVGALLGVAITIAPLGHVLPASPWWGFVPVVVMVAVQLGALRLAAGKWWTALFREVHRFDVAVMIVVALANLVVSFLVSTIVVPLFGANANPGAQQAQGDAAQRVSLYLTSLIEIMGEELFAIVVFLAILTLATRIGVRRRGAVILAWLLSNAAFAACHLPVYQFNFAQAFLIIGVGSLGLTLAYIRTKNIWVSYGAHIIYDWILFSLAAASPHQ
jgi:membrane protease YdiL (CAAX protease family)